MKKILIIFGTRPEAIKMAPLVKEFSKHPKNFDIKVCVTAQHREMLDSVLDFFEIVPDYDFNIMKKNQTLHSITSDILLKMEELISKFKPDFAFVHGDTTTALASGLACFYSGVKVCHVEAGLRTYNKYAPFPEEMNRQCISRIADYHFAPTTSAKTNLLSEKISEAEESIIVTGNTVIDALFYSKEKVKNLSNHKEIEYLKTVVKPEKDLVLVTGHRRENFGKGFENICEALSEISKLNNVQVIYPVHLNPNVQKPVNKLLKGNSNIHLIDPLSYPSFVWLMNKSKIVLTDSGGIQEEAPSLGKPVLVMRETTERPEAVEAGTVILVGTDVQKIVENTASLLSDEKLYTKMSHLHNPYGDGKACQRIIEHLS